MVTRARKGSDALRRQTSVRLRAYGAGSGTGLPPIAAANSSIGFNNEKGEAMTETKKHGFTCAGITECGETVYEAQFQLVDDGCPDSDRFLRLQVLARADERPQTKLRLALVYTTRVRWIAEAEIPDIEAAAGLLYGAAKLVTTKTLVPC